MLTGSALCIRCAETTKGRLQTPAFRSRSTNESALHGRGNDFTNYCKSNFIRKRPGKRARQSSLLSKFEFYVNRPDLATSAFIAFFEASKRFKAIKRELADSGSPVEVACGTARVRKQCALGSEIEFHY